MINITPCLINYCTRYDSKKPVKIPINFQNLTSKNNSVKSRRLREHVRLRRTLLCSGWLQHWGRGAAGREQNSVTPYTPATGNV